MADYIYLLENRLSRAQREALHQVRETARAHGMTVFLVGGAVRDLTSGAPIRDLNFAIQGDARQLAGDLGRHGKLLGSNDLMQSLYFSFPGGVRLEVGSTLNVTYPRPGKPSVHPASVLDDLRRRDFTANAMAISLNEGSYGLLMDPTNGVADVENRELRLLSNYGFLEEPSRMIRATRLAARLGWQMEERTQIRYGNAKIEGSIAALGDWERRYEAEAIFREEDPLRVMRKLEEEGWLAQLSPALIPAKVDEGELDRLRELVGQLNSLGLFPDTSAAVFPMITAKLGAANVAQLKQGFSLPGFAGQIEGLEEKAKSLATEFLSKANAAASVSWKLLMAAEPEAVLWMSFSSKSNAVQAKLKLFFNEWPHARQKIPYGQMQEMRITADLPGYEALLDSLFFAAMDGKLDSPEAIKAFLEPFSPPAAPPPPTLRRRAVKRESKTAKSRAKKPVAADASQYQNEFAATEAPAVETSSVLAKPGPATDPAPQAAPAKAAEVSAKADRAEVVRRASATPAMPVSPAGAAKKSAAAQPARSGVAKAKSTAAAASAEAAKERPAAAKAVKAVTAKAAPAKAAAPARVPGPARSTAAAKPGAKARTSAAKATGPERGTAKRAGKATRAKPTATRQGGASKPVKAGTKARRPVAARKAAPVAKTKAAAKAKGKAAGAAGGTRPSGKATGKSSAKARRH